MLDTSKLHTYRYNEDLFKKVTILPDGKNHGLLFSFDWSGSMSEIFATVKQLLDPTSFCKKYRSFEESLPMNGMLFVAPRKGKIIIFLIKNTIPAKNVSRAKFSCTKICST